MPARTKTVEDVAFNVLQENIVVPKETARRAPHLIHPMGPYALISTLKCTSTNRLTVEAVTVAALLESNAR